MKVIQYAYPSSMKAKELGFEKEGVAYLQEIIGPNTMFYETSDDILHTTITLDEMIQYTNDNNIEISRYSVGIFDPREDIK